MSDDRVLSCLDQPEISRVDCPTRSVHEFFDRTGRRSFIVGNRRVKMLALPRNSRVALLYTLR